MLKYNKSKRVILAIILILMTVTSSAYASEVNSKLYADNFGDSVAEDGMLIVIYDANGNIVETHAMSRQIYVNGTQYTIPANGSMRTYQYDTTIDFTAGFYFIHSDYSGNATTRNRSVKISIYNSATVGGTKYFVKSKTFSTNEEDNTSYSGYVSGIQPGCSSVALSDNPTSSSRPYYDALYKNQSSKSLTISLLVARD